MNARLLGLAFALLLVGACGHSNQGQAGGGSSIPPRTVTPSAEPLVVPPGWTPYANAKLGFTLAYPSDTFRLDETPSGVTFTSSLSRDGLGEDPKAGKWVYGLHVSVHAGAPTAVLQKDYGSFYESAFPGGKFQETESIAALELAGRHGYQLVMGVEGYNSRVVLLPKGAGSTLVLDFRSIGGVMSPSTPEDQQTAVFDQMIASFKMD